MTAVAFRAGKMAADTMTVFEHTKATDTKIIAHEGFLIGVTGEICPSNDHIRRWFFATTKGRHPEFKDAKFELLVVDPKGKISTLESSGLAYSLPRLKFWALGAGAEVCLGAMEMGATAEQAVRAAIKWQASCGGRVIVRSLKSATFRR